MGSKILMDCRNHRLSLHGYEQLAWTVRRASLLGSTELTKGSEALRRVTIESPLPALDTSAAIILNTESPGVVSSPAKAYPQNNHR